MQELGKIMRGGAASIDEARRERVGLSTRRRAFVASAALVAVLCLGAIGWVGVRAALAAGALAGVESAVEAVGAEAGNEPGPGDGSLGLTDIAAAVPQLGTLAADAERADSLVGDPLWMLAEHVPGIGPNLAVLRVVAEEAHVLLGGVAVPLARSVDAERGALTVGERVDLEALARIGAEVVRSAEEARGSLARLDALRPAGAPGVLPATAEAAAGLTALAAKAVRVLEPAAVLTSRASALLGGEGERRYLAMFLTPAELRASGGLPGAAAAFGADSGTITRGDIYSTRDYSPAPAQPVVELTESEIALYGTRPARLIQDTTATEDFTRAALFASALTQLHHGYAPDGVLAVDVVALGYLLEALGPVALAGGDALTADNASALLMNEAYLRYPDPRDQDAFFADVAARVFDRAIGGDLDPVAAIAALVRAAEEDRILLWSGDPLVQGALDALDAPEVSPARADLGVYLNDRTSAKMGFYLDARAQIVWAGCEDAERLDQVRVEMTNTVDPAIVPGLPWYITGGGMRVPEGVISTQIVAVGPHGAIVSGTGDTPAETIVVGGDGRPRVAWTVDLAPGESAARSAVFSSPGTEGGSPRIDATPAVGVAVDESSGSLAKSCRVGG